jgi:hypothetical protein
MDRVSAAQWASRFPSLLIEPSFFLLVDDPAHPPPTQSIQPIKWVQPHNPAIGVVFGLEIETESMLPDFAPGEVVLLDTGVKPQPSDFVAAMIIGEPRVTFRRLRVRGRGDNGLPVFQLIARNHDFASPLIADEPTTIEGAQVSQGRILGTLVEHRRFRFRVFERMTEANRKAARESSDQFRAAYKAQVGK